MPNFSHSVKGSCGTLGVVVVAGGVVETLGVLPLTAPLLELLGLELEFELELALALLLPLSVC